jgi:hypothetical protein
MKSKHPAPSRRNDHTTYGILLVCFIAVLLGSCAPTFLYRHADRLILWKLDEYTDLTSTQKTWIRERLKALLAQHRKEALPRYEAFLTQIKEKSADGLDRQEVDWMLSTYEELRADLFGRLVDDGGAVLSSLSDQQVRYLHSRFQRDHEKTLRRLQESRESRLSKRASVTLSWLKDWLGPLTTVQQLRILELSKALPDMAPAWVDNQRIRQQDMIHLLDSTRDRRVLSRYMNHWLLSIGSSRPPDYQHVLDQMHTSVKEMVLIIDHFITRQQRDHALTKLQQLIDEVHALRAS